MRTRFEQILAVLIPTLFGVFVMTALLRLFVVPLAFNDTYRFIEAATLSPNMIGVRPPLYGLLLIAAKAMGWPMFTVWFQIFFWTLCITTFATLVLNISGNIWRTVIAGTLFVMIETAIMYTPSSQWFLLSDVLYANFSVLGIFLMLIGLTYKKNTLIWTGAAFLGTATLIRPVLASSVIAIPILLYSTSIRTALRSKRFIGGAAIILMPILLLSVGNKILANSFSLSAVGGLNITYYVRALLDPNEKIFDDPSLDHAFHLALEKGIVDPDHTGFDPWYLEGTWWHPIFQFYGSLSSTKNHAAKRFELGAMNGRIARTLIARHPMQYMELMFTKVLTTMVPIKSDRDMYFMRSRPWEFENILGYNWQSTKSNQWRIGDNFADSYSADVRIAEWINAERYGIRLPKKPGPKSVFLLTVFTVFALTESLRRLRSKDESMRILGLSILVCIGHTYLNAFAVALITLHHDPRYGLPGIMTGTAALLLSLLSLSLRKFPFSISIKIRRRSENKK